MVRVTVVADAVRLMTSIMSRVRAALEIVRLIGNTVRLMVSIGPVFLFHAQKHNLFLFVKEVCLFF